MAASVSGGSSSGAGPCDAESMETTSPLEEPPAHVKFLFATTEVNKVPVTVLSRCQRFDLRRIPAEALAAHFAEVSAKEGVEVEP